MVKNTLFSWTSRSQAPRQFLPAVTDKRNIPRLSFMGYYSLPEKKAVMYHMLDKVGLDTFEPPNKKLPYNISPDKYKLGLGTHRGRRKILISDILFLSEMRASNPCVVLYAGAAPGRHIPLLSQMFPQITFYLYDSRPFAIEESDRIKINARQLEVADLQRPPLKGQVTYLISDLQHAEEIGADEAEELKREQNLVQDQERQKVIVQALAGQPSFKKACLKFRIPFTTQLYQYFEGKLYSQAWTGQFSNEMRMYTDGRREKLYELKDIEQRFYFRNLVERTWIWYKHNITADGTDHCFDCAFEVRTLQTYFRNIQKITEPDELRTSVQQLMDKISRYIQPLRFRYHGLKPQLQMYQKWDVIQQQFMQ